MGIFDFFKSSEKKEKEKEKETAGSGNNNAAKNAQIRRQIYDIANNESEMMESGNYSDDFTEISYYDDFGKNLRCQKKTGLIKNCIHL